MDSLLVRLLEGRPLAISEWSQIAREDPARLENFLEEHGASRMLYGWSSRVPAEEAAGGKGLHAVLEAVYHPEWEEDWAEMAEWIASLPMVDSCYRWAGRNELLLFIRFPSVAEAAEWIHSIFGEPVGIMKCFMHLLLNRYEDQGYLQLRG